jgi:glutamate-1-semialdehyde 2,1-aminomutase
LASCRARGGRRLMATTTHRFDRSLALHARAAEVLAGGVSTAFRAFERPVPLTLASAQGARLTDVDGNELVDFVCGMGPIILGHGHPEVVAAVREAAGRLQQAGAQSEAEVALAEQLRAAMPSLERLRFGLSGSEAVHAALRTARAATGRPLVAKFAGHYHGWLDPILTATSHLPPAEPETGGQQPSALADVVALEWNDGTALEALFADRGHDLAAVIAEPYPCNGGVIPAAPGYLERLRALCDAHGALLVFDEVITGFRAGLGGAQGLLGVRPDLTVVAKALGNGFPISAFGGRADVMDEVGANRAMHAGTYNGGGISIAAGHATVSALAGDAGLYGRLGHLAARLRQGLEDAGARHGHRLVTAGTGGVFFAWFRDEGGVATFRDHLGSDLPRYARFAALMLEEGVRLIPAGRWYLSAAHGEAEVDAALAAADRALPRLTR